MTRNVIVNNATSKLDFGNNPIKLMFPWRILDADGTQDPNVDRYLLSTWDC